MLTWEITNWHHPFLIHHRIPEVRGAAPFMPSLRQLFPGLKYGLSSKNMALPVYHGVYWIVKFKRWIFIWWGPKPIADCPSLMNNKKICSESTNLRWSGGSGFRTLDSWIQSVIRIATKIASLGPWAMPYPSKKFRQNPFTSSRVIRRTDRQTDKQTELKT